MAGESGAYVHAPNQSEVRWLGETFAYFLATGDQTGGLFTLVDEQARRGMAVPLHKHRDDVESFYVLDGEISFFIGDQPGMRVGAGAFAHVPGGIVHGFRVESESARYLILTTPHHGEFYEAITLAAGPDGAAPAESVTDEQIQEACAKYGVEFVGPLPD
jgi:quercetin dioxygenase-like cupin family protein